MSNYENLKVWQKSIELVDLIYRLTRNFPKDEVFGLTSQIRRATVSIALNIAEGSGKTTNKDFCRFFHDSLGSLREVVTLLIIAKKQDYINAEQLDQAYADAEEISRMIYGLEKKLLGSR